MTRGRERGSLAGTTAQIRALGRPLIFAITALGAAGVVAVAVVSGADLYDARVYWLAWHGQLYGGAFVYPPPGALLAAPAAVLPWPIFAATWLAVLVLAGLWLLWPLPIWLRMPLLAALVATYAWGNAAPLVAVALALAPRWPMLWAVIAWTKVTPAAGLVALLRVRAWRQLALALGAIVVVGVATLIVAPGTLAAWIMFLLRHPAVPRFLPGLLPFAVPLAVRVPVAALIAWAGASRPWTLAVAAAVATPDLSVATCGLLAAVPRLAEGRPAHVDTGRVRRRAQDDAERDRSLA